MTTPLGLLTDAALSWLVSTVNSALGGTVLSVSDSDGFSVAVAVPGEPSVALDNFQAGASGVSGRLHIEDLDQGNPLSVTMFGDFSVALTAFDVTVASGAIAAMNIAGALTIPYFTTQDATTGQHEPETLDIDVSVRSDGELAVTLSAQQSGGTTPDGLAALHYDLAGATIDLSLASLEIEHDADAWKVTLTGTLALGAGGSLNWPSVDLRGLSIDSKGNISLAGGWIDLPSQTALDFFGFQVALHQLGFGTDAAGDRWIGFSGDVQLVEGVPIGGSVRGLQINLETGAVSFSGVGVDFTIPGVISFSGDVEHIHLDTAADATAQGLPAGFPVPADIFAGQVDVTVEAAGDLELDAAFIVANVPRSSFPAQVQAGIATDTVPCFFLSFEADLPAPIPLFVDIGLYGVSGLFATNLYPTVGSDSWWDWFKYPTSNGAPDTTQLPDYTATDAGKWLNPRPGAFALGAGAVIGTQDDGFTASAAIALMIIMPGPVIAFVGAANILSKRIAGPSGPANFDAFATYDGNTGIFDLTIDANYSIPYVLQVSGTAEVYVDPSPPDPVWFLAIGRPPHTQRIQARILDLFESDFYFVVSDTGLVTGFWIGYKNSWTFGPLGASIDAYLAAMGAIQWSPFQIAAGVELHGEVQLEAFGISLGITADALIEATAPHPYWLYGSFHVGISMPWPLPSVGATVSLSWGGDDGSVPPAPLALNVVSATMADHGASDAYELLAHRPGTLVNEAQPGDTVTYDTPSAPGILAAQPTGYWTAKYPTVGTDPSPVVPDLGPAALKYAPLIPQDSHFTLAFAHPVGDSAHFSNAQPVVPDTATVKLPAIVGPDDMSNLNPTPPAVQWLISHSLLEVALFQYDMTSQAWVLEAALPQGNAPLPLVGSWVTPDPGTSGGKPMTKLRLCSAVPEPGQFATAIWSGPPASLGTSFTSQNLAFALSPGLPPATVSATGLATGSFGLRFGGGTVTGQLTIGFPAPVRLLAVSGVQLAGAGAPAQALVVSSGGQPLPLAGTAPDSSGTFTTTIDSSAPLVSSIQLAAALEVGYLTGLAYEMPEVNLPILPAAPALYALKVVTQVEAGRVDSSGSPTFQPVPDGAPVIEFGYFQCASGPGTAVIEAPQTPPTGFPAPLPSQQPPVPPLAVAAQTSATDFPNGGRLNDLATYTQWSWPDDGDTTAYYGYDINVEFNETYVVSLYAAVVFGGLSEQAPAALLSRPTVIPLHFRCVDRNNAHVLIPPGAVHVPSVPQQSALAGPVTVPALPPAATPPTPAPRRPVAAGLPVAYSAAVVAQATAAVRASAAATAGLHAPPARLSPAAGQALEQAMAGAGVPGTAASLGTALQLNPGVATAVLKELAELAAAATIREQWFAALAPQTRYTLDVVGGAVSGTNYANGLGSYPAIFAQQDAQATLAALEAYLVREDALTTLQRVQFTTSRYATFTAHLANVAAQLAGTASSPVRQYAVADDTAAWTWLTTGTNDGDRTTKLTAYQQSRQKLATLVSGFQSLYDETLAQPLTDPTQGSGEAALAAQRAATGQAWQELATATSASFDGLVTALGRKELASGQHAAPPPDTELSLFTIAGGSVVTALLIESPEPFDWPRIWQWVTLPSVLSALGPGAAPTVLWSADGTRALVVPPSELRGKYDLVLTFQGNIGAEAACITEGGESVSETVSVGPIQLGPFLRRLPSP